MHLLVRILRQKICLTFAGVGANLLFFLKIRVDITTLFKFIYIHLFMFSQNKEQRTHFLNCDPTRKHFTFMSHQNTYPRTQ
jgi:hypothetical protein